MLTSVERALRCRKYEAFVKVMFVLYMSVCDGERSDGDVLLWVKCYKGKNDYCCKKKIKEINKKNKCSN